MRPYRLSELSETEVDSLKACPRIGFSSIFNTGIRCKPVSRSITSVDLYVPGGTAVLPSTTLMLAVAISAMAWGISSCQDVPLTFLFSSMHNSEVLVSIDMPAALSLDFSFNQLLAPHGSLLPPLHRLVAHETSLSEGISESELLQETLFCNQVWL
ncbi:hypothetical protein MKX03_015207 [Papaver bracteatum]|nr:hypothetical protein MKX03_015207 [Papaver bracteatum]